jgi:hypothetical protein
MDRNKMKILILYITLICTLSADPDVLVPKNSERPLPKNQAEIRKVADPNGFSFFKAILKQENLQEDGLTVKEFKMIFEKYGYLLDGGIKDVSEFLTMKDLCDAIKANNNKHELNDFLLDAFKNVKPLNGKAEFWPEYLVTTSGGRAGLLADCLLDISEEKNFNEMFSYCTKTNDALKMNSLLTAISKNGRESAVKYNKLILPMMKTVKDKNITELVENFLSNYQKQIK